MKQNYLAIITIIVLLIDFLLSWYHFEILYVVNRGMLDLVYILFRLIFLILFFIIIIKNIKSSFKPNYRVLDRIILLILIFYISFMFSTDIDLLKTKIEFNKYLDDRIEIINKIKKDNIKGTIKLTEKSKRLAPERCVKIYQNDEKVTSISFSILSAALSSDIGLVYTNDINSLMKLERTEEVLKIKDNWYYIIF